MAFSTQSLATDILASPEENFSIRAFSTDDSAALCKLAHEIWHEHYVPTIASREQIDYMLARWYKPEILLSTIAERSQVLYVAIENEMMIGYCACEPRSDGWFLDKLYVSTAHQGRGIGTRLLHAATRHAPSAQWLLRVNRKNMAAINFYFRHGFTITSLDCLDIGKGFVMDDFIMKRAL